MKKSKERFPNRFRITAASLVLATSVSIMIAFGANQTSAISLTTGTISAKVSNHIGIDKDGNPDGTATSNCVHYDPLNGATSSGWVTNSSSPNEAQTAHGKEDSTCPSSLDINEQSAVGIRPAAATSFTNGVPFLLARVIHYNNPIRGTAEYWKGQLDLQMAGFDGTPSIGLDWWMWETPNNADPCPGGTDFNGCFDEIKFTTQIGDKIVSQGGRDFRLVVTGFIPSASDTVCPASPDGDVNNVFWTKENGRTDACIYAEISEVRKVSITKTVVGNGEKVSAPSSTFGFITDGTLSDSPWNKGSFNLIPPTDGSITSLSKEVVPSDVVTITENAHTDSRWALSNIVCTDFDGKGNPRQLPSGATYNIDTRQLTLSDVPAPDNIDYPDINCTFTNSYTPKASLTLVKELKGGSAQISDFTLKAEGDDSAPTNGTTISGSSGDPGVTNEIVPAGSYTLSEKGPSGYISDSGWSCEGGSILKNVVTLADDARAICTISNRFQTGDFRINVVVNAPLGAVTTTDRSFTGTYTCGSDDPLPFTAQTTVPFETTGLATGSACSATAAQPTGDLANESYRWLTPTYSTQPVNIEDGKFVEVTITYAVVQDFGTFSITKSVDGPVGYTGSKGRVFPITYDCRIGEITVASGVLNAVVGEPSSPGQIPTTAVCDLNEKLILEDGDFADSSYEWTGAVFSTSSPVIATEETTPVSVTNSYERVFGSFSISKVVTGATDGLVSGTSFAITVSCGEIYNETFAVTVGSSAVTASLPRGTLCAISEASPTSGLASEEYSWGETPATQNIAVATTAQSVTVTNNIIFTAATTTTLPTTTTTTTTLPVVTTTTVPGDDLQSLLPLEDEPELQVLLPATGSSTNYFGYMGLLLLSLGMVLLRRKRIAR